MANRTEAQNLIQRALDLFETIATFDRSAAMKCHIAGLQGEKRRMRYLYRKAKCVVDCLQHGAWDMFDPGLELYPKSGSADVSSMTNTQTCMRKIIDTLWKVHDEAHAIANDMVMAKLKSLSCPVYDYCDCLTTIISEMNRNYRSYEMSGWDWHHITRHQETDCNIHDKYEDKEEGQGYSDHKEA